MVVGWYMTGVSESKLPLTLTASGPTQTPHLGILPSLIKPEQTILNTALVYSMHKNQNRCSYSLI